jgi:hypothetical protein
MTSSPCDWFTFPPALGSHLVNNKIHAHSFRQNLTTIRKVVVIKQFHLQRVMLDEKYAD